MNPGPSPWLGTVGLEGAVGLGQWPSQQKYGQVALRIVTLMLWLSVNLPENQS